MTESILRVSDLVVEIPTSNGPIRPVDGVDLDISPGETVGIVGESGAGKSMTAMSVIGLIPHPARIAGGEVVFGGENLVGMPTSRLRRIRGAAIGVIFQDPMNSLNPVLTVGHQMFEAIRVHDRVSSKAAIRDRVIQLMKIVGLADASRHYDQYPLELSGGMRQRVMIAMAIANEPRLIIADEPTTALDVTIQAQVLEALQAAQEATGAAVLIITHDLGVVAEMADRVVVMYGGKVVERARVVEIFDNPRHPYTVGLLESLPDVRNPRAVLGAIPGQPPRLTDMPSGCAFRTRCSLGSRESICAEQSPDLIEVDSDHFSACHFAVDLAGQRSILTVKRP